MEHSLSKAKLLGSLGHVAVSQYSFETLELFREVMARLSRERTGSGDSPPVEITTYVIELHFNQLADESDRRFFNSVPTSLQLPAKTVDRLRQLAAHQLTDNAEFKRLVRDLASPTENCVLFTGDLSNGGAIRAPNIERGTAANISLEP